MVHREAVAADTTRSRQKRAVRISCVTGFTERGPAIGAGWTDAADRQERHDDVIAASKIGDVRAQLGYDGRSFMTERHRQWTRTIAVDCRQIRMAHSGCGNFDQNLIWPRRRQVYRLDRQWS